MPPKKQTTAQYFKSIGQKDPLPATKARARAQRVGLANLKSGKAKKVAPKKQTTAQYFKSIGQKDPLPATKARAREAAAKKSVAQLRKEAAAKKRAMCPPVSKMSKAQLINFLKK